jgi:catechol 2,3-dioxygenase-like lactoylglutathione lyase family enzyme
MIESFRPVIAPSRRTISGPLTGESPADQRTGATIDAMRHLALAVRDRERSRSFYEAYLGFDAQPAREYDDGVLMLYDREGFALALGPTNEQISLPSFLHFGRGLPTADDVRAFRERLLADGVEIADWWDEPDYVSVKFRDPDGYVVEVAWEP